jgi:flagellar protein FliO/FliZ
MSTFMLMLRLLTALAFVGGLLWFMTRSAKNGKFTFLLGSGPTQDSLEVTSQRPLGRNSSVALVRAGERHLLLGVSEHGVQLLAEGADLCSPIKEPTSDQDDRIDLAALARGDAPSTDAGPTGSNTSDRRQAAPKHLPAMFTPTQPRMTLIESLRELTVRKS